MARVEVTIKQMKEIIKEADGKEIGFDLDNISTIRLEEIYGTANMCLQSKRKLDQMIQEHELDLV